MIKVPDNLHDTQPGCSERKHPIVQRQHLTTYRAAVVVEYDAMVDRERNRAVRGAGGAGQAKGSACQANDHTLG